MLFGKNNVIRDKVMSFVTERIEKAQAAYDEECARLEETAQQEINEINIKLEINKNATAENLVARVLGKVLEA